MAEKTAAVASALRFDPHWIFDPAWWFVEELGQEARQQAIQVQLELTKATLTAQLQAVEKIQGIVGRAR